MGHGNGVKDEFGTNKHKQFKLETDRYIGEPIYRSVSSLNCFDIRLVKERVSCQKTSTRKIQTRAPLQHLRCVALTICRRDEFNGPRSICNRFDIFQRVPKERFLIRS